MLPPDLDGFFVANDGRIRDELFEFLRIPSVSARSEHNADTARAAEWVASNMGTRDFGRRFTRLRGIRWWSESGAAPAARLPRSLSTDITTSSPPSRWSCGPVRPLSQRFAAVAYMRALGG